MITKMLPEHIDIVMNIWLEENVSAHSFIGADFWISKFNEVKNLIRKSEIYVYIIDNEVVGFIGVEKSYIAGLFVKQNYQRMGIGKKLLEKCKSMHNQISLKVFKDNFKALNFYLKNSFKIKKECTDEETQKTEYFMQYSSSTKF